MMKIKQLLYLLALAVFIFSSCKKDDKDYRDKFEGIYETDVVGLITLIDAMDLPVRYSESIAVNKIGNTQLMFTIGSGIMTATVNEQGDFTFPDESGYQTLTYYDGLRITMTFTVSIAGTITNKMLYMKETYSGNAIIEIDGEVIPTKLSGIIVYNGTKK